MEIHVSRDIRTYKAKDIGNFSFKEAGWITLALGSGILTWYISRSLELSLLPMSLILVFGFFRPCRMSMYQFISTVVKDLLTPRVYVWEKGKETFNKDPEELEEEENLLQVAAGIEPAPCEIEKGDRALLFK